MWGRERASSVFMSSAASETIVIRWKKVASNMQMYGGIDHLVRWVEKFHKFMSNVYHV